MIVRITGKLTDVNSEYAILERDGICYEILIPAFMENILRDDIGQTIVFHTLEYFEGSAVGGNLYHRLIGFIESADRDFFVEFVKVRGLGYRKALRAFAAPTREIANAIEQEDVKRLMSLPEIGKRTAQQIIASLKGKLDQFIWGEAATPMGETEELTRQEREALEILIQLGERRNEALQMIRTICQKNSSLKDAGLIVEAVYKHKAGHI